jgi:hypothetical protein
MIELTPLRSLLRQPPSRESCLGIIGETSALYKEDVPSRWFFLLLNRIFCQIIDNPELIYPDTAEPVLDTIFAQSLLALDDIDDSESLTRAAWQLTEAYCGLR